MHFSILDHIYNALGVNWLDVPAAILVKAGRVGDELLDVAFRCCGELIHGN